MHAKRISRLEIFKSVPAEKVAGNEFDDLEIRVE